MALSIARFLDRLRAGLGLIPSEGEFRRLNADKAHHVHRPGIDYRRALYFRKRGHRGAAIEALKEELRYFPESKKAAELLSLLRARQAKNPPAPAPAEFEELYEAIKPYTMVTREALIVLYEQAKEVCGRDLPGNFVECGVAAGGSSAMLAAIIARHSQRPRCLFSCDTFEGMPAPGGHDHYQGVNAEETGWGAGTCAAPVDSLREICRQLQVEHLVEPVKGLFADTLPIRRADFGEIALLHMDGDWYESTRDILVNLYGQVTPGGAIQIDDYGYWEGCKMAIAEYGRAHGIIWDLHAIEGRGAWTRKPAVAG